MGRFSFTAPQWEHVLLLGQNLSASTKRDPCHTHLYARCLRSSAGAASAAARARRRFRIIPATPSVSTTTAP